MIPDVRRDEAMSQHRGHFSTTLTSLRRRERQRRQREDPVGRPHAHDDTAAIKQRADADRLPTELGVVASRPPIVRIRGRLTPGVLGEGFGVYGDSATTRRNQLLKFSEKRASDLERTRMPATVRAKATPVSRERDRGEIALRNICGQPRLALGLPQTHRPRDSKDGKQHSQRPTLRGFRGGRALPFFRVNMRGTRGLMPSLERLPRCTFSCPGKNNTESSRQPQILQLRKKTKKRLESSGAPGWSNRRGSDKSESSTRKDETSCARADCARQREKTQKRCVTEVRDEPTLGFFTALRSVE